MAELSVGVRDLKARFSEYLRRVKAGQTISITEHGRPVGRIVPAAPPLNERLEALRRAGIVSWSGARLNAAEPVVQVRGDRSVADLLIEDRE